MNPLILLTVGVFICVSVTVQVTALPTDHGETFQSQQRDDGFYDCCQV